MTSARKHQVPVRKLARLAHAARVVIERHPELPAARMIATTLMPTTHAFEETLSRIDLLQVRVDGSQLERDRSRDALQGTLRTWLVVLRHGADTKLQRFGQSESILSLFAAAEEALGLLDRLSPELSAIARAELRPAHDRALAAHRALIDVRRELNDQQSLLRELAARLQPDLVFLRNALRLALGPSHLDYQSLRIRRRRRRHQDGAALTDDDDDALEATLDGPSTSAPTD
jgi:hypothetical protein